MCVVGVVDLVTNTGSISEFFSGITLVEAAVHIQRGFVPIEYAAVTLIEEAGHSIRDTRMSPDTRRRTRR